MFRRQITVKLVGHNKSQKQHGRCPFSSSTLLPLGAILCIRPKPHWLSAETGTLAVFENTFSSHPFFERGCPFSPLRKLFTPFLFIADSYVESAGECSPSPVHAERGYTNKPFSLNIFKLYRRKVLNRFPECCKTRFDRKLYCEKKQMGK